MKINMIQTWVVLGLVLGGASVGWGEAGDADAATRPVEGVDVDGDLDAQISELEARIAGLKQAREDLGESEEEIAASPAPLVPPVPPVPVKPVKLTQRQERICGELGIDPKRLAGLIAKPLYEFNETEVDVYLRYLGAFEPELPRRVAHLARKNIGQPYELYLLGEMPFEHYDPQPIYSLGKSDCLVYAEHIYAMALTDSWEGFIRMLQRVRYKDGQIGVVTRNHYTEADWNPNNGWLVRDITAELARDRVVRFGQKVDRAKFLRKRYKLETDIPVQEYEHEFIRFEDIDMAKPRLRDGDFVNIVRGTPAKPGDVGEAGGSVKAGRRGAKSDTMRDIFGGSAWVGHTGLIVLGDDGEVHLIHSAPPEVREEPIDDYIARATANLEERDAAGKPRLLGFKFLRLRKDPWDNLRKLDGPDAPRVSLPGGGSLE